MKITKEMIIKYLGEISFWSFDDKGNPQYWVYIDEDGKLTHDTDYEFEAYVAPSWEDLGYEYHKQLYACEKHGKYDDFEYKFGDPKAWLEEKEDELSPEYISEVVMPLLRQVEKYLEKVEG